MAQVPNTPGRPAGPEEADPSMDDILASIRRILDEDPAAQKPAEHVLVLDSSMLVDEPGTDPQPEALPAAPSRASAAERVPLEAPRTLAAEEETIYTAPVNDDPLSTESLTVSRDPSVASALVAPAAAAAAANSVGSLMRTLAAERTAALGRGGLTIEDLVREEIRPLLKLWLDTHLPPIVERLVRAEIERVVSRQAG